MCLLTANPLRLVNDLIHALEQAQEQGFDPGKLNTRWKRILENLLRAFEKGLDYKHPFFVGPFGLVGRGGLVL